MLTFPFNNDVKFTVLPKHKGVKIPQPDMVELTVKIENPNQKVSFEPVWKWNDVGIEIEIQREKIPIATTYYVTLDWRKPDGSFSDKYQDLFGKETIQYVPDACHNDCGFLAMEMYPDFKGDPGDSPYELAVKHGYVGTEEEWLESLKGKGLPTGGDAGQVLLKLTDNDYDYTWGNAGSGTGDMQSALYDPDGIKSDVFDMDNMKEGEENLLFKQSDKETISGKYLKPENGIPESDLSESVQESLSKADAALQEYTETDPTVPSWAKEASKPTYTANEVGALPETHNTDSMAHTDIRQAITAVSESLEGVETDISELRDNVSSIGQNVSVVEDNVSTLEQNVSNIGQTVSIHGEEINDIKTTLGDVSTVLDIISGEVV